MAGPTSKNRFHDLLEMVAESKHMTPPRRTRPITPPAIRQLNEADRVTNDTIDELRANLQRAASRVIATLDKAPRPKRSKEPTDDASKRFRLLELD